MKHLSRALVVFLIGGLVGTIRTLAAQSKAELRRKYGAPIAETFLVRPGITATATYGPGGRIVEWVITPRIKEKEKSRNWTLNYDVVKGIIDELVPTPVRGKGLSSGILNATCMPANDCGGTEQDYQNVTIYFNRGAAGLSYAVVQWNVRTGRGR